MDPKKMQSIVWFIIWVCVIWYVGYNRYTVYQINKYVEYNNAQVSADNKLISSANSSTNWKINELLLTSDILATKNMVEKWCNYLKKSANKTKCKETYTKYSQALEKLKNGVTPEVATDLDKWSEEIQKLQGILSKEEWIEFK